MSDDYRTFSGWLRDHEDWGYLDRTCLSNETLRAMRSSDFEPEKEMDPRPWHKIENQLRMNSCAGNSLASVMEMCYKIATGDSSLQLSRMFAYVRTQMRDGIRGDSGATISGAAWVAKNVGCGREKFWPYTGQYTRQIPPACSEDAKNYVIRSAMRLRSYEDCYTFLSSGLGGIHIGIQWNEYCNPDREGFLNWRPSRSRRAGGHALGSLGYDSDGNLWWANSHGTGWGDRGFARVRPEVIDAMFRHPWTVMIGLSDMAVPKPRKPKIQFLVD